MFKVGKVTAGSIPNTSILEVLQTIDWREFGVEFCQISCIDSNHTPAKLPSVHKLISECGINETHVLGDNMVISYADMLLIPSSSSIFCGFDEVWLSTAMPQIIIPNDISIEGVPITEWPDTHRDHIIIEIPKWMRTNCCILVLGDGCGLNYVTNSDTVAAKMESFAQSID